MSAELPGGEFPEVAGGTGAGPEFEVARVFDFADPVTGPGFEPGHRVVTDRAERDRLLGYLRGGALVLTSTARMHDVLDPERGESGSMTFRTDGRWIWTDTVAYYLDRHGLAPEDRLTAHIEARWARGQAPGADLATAGRAADFLLDPPESGPDTAVWTVGS